MSTKYTGGFITKSPVAPTTSAASGIWTLDQQQQAQKAGTWPSPPIFIEDLFSTWLYTGTGAAQTITNGVDVSGKGGLVWLKRRDVNRLHDLFDTSRGATQRLFSNENFAQSADATSLTAFNSSGFALGTDSDINASAGSFVSWTFAEQPKFFDIVTWSGNDVAGRQIAHNIGSTPGMVIIKSLATDDWVVWHRSLTSGNYIVLNSTAAQTTSAAANRFGNGTTTVDPTATVFTVGNNGTVNQSGNNYVAYLFAHNAGGFPASGTGSTNGISCGSFTTVSSAATVDLGYEPQWILWKRTDAVQNWNVYDTMRGWAQKQVAQLYPNLTQAEDMYLNSEYFFPTATGFQLNSSFGLAGTYIYVAIRRGPMAVPTVGTSVFAPSTAIEPQSSPLFTAGFSDMTLHSPRVSESGNGHLITDRLRGNGVILETPYTSAENTSSTYFKYDSNNGAYIPNLGYFNNTGGTSKPYALRAFKRAPSFFDEVCYLGNGSTQNVSHNLGVVPELMIVKSRSLADSDWWVYSSALTTPQNKYLRLQSTDGESTATGLWGSSLPTSTTFGLGAFAPNSSGATFVAYLFATCAGVSKVGSYTGNGSSQTINCGFTGGARFVLIKKSSGTGDWMVSDSARGIVSGNDPYLELNNTNAEVTGEDWLDTDSTGFVVNEVSGSNANTNGATYIFLAIA